ncbi:MAG: hypothetical protein K9H12_16090 [Bacteroidales bacterium]|nr:hypothetical protein [Bacteroidales bacterium]
MKKIAFVFIFMLIAGFGFSQKSQVQSAIVYHRQGRLDKAKEAIDKAAENEKTITDSKTWFYRGKIYIDMYNNPDTAIKNLDPDAINKSYDSYMKARELDTKGEWTNDIAMDLPIVGEAFFNQGANSFNEGMKYQDMNDTVAAVKTFTKSMTSFEKAFEIYSASGINDTTTIYYVSVAAELAGDYEKAKKNLITLVDMQYPKPSIFSSLATIYYNHDKNVEKSLSTFKEGRAKYPEDLNLLLLETNVFLSEEMTEEALDNLQMAAMMDTLNPTIFFAIGAKYNEIVDDTSRTKEMREDAFEKAVVAYDKSLELKPDYFDPAYNMGALYVNKASSIIDVANQLPLSAVKEYDEMKAQADGYLEKCVPYLEKAHELDPTDRSTMYSLKEIYTRIGKADKVKEINAKLEEN